MSRHVRQRHSDGAGLYRTKQRRHLTALSLRRRLAIVGKSDYVTMSSCIATQLPHAVGMAMAAKLRHDPVYI